MDQDFSADLISLLDEDGKEWKFEILDEIDNDDGVFYALLPVVTTVLGIVILREQPTVKFLIGGLVIIAGVVVAILGERRRGTPQGERHPNET